MSSAYPTHTQTLPPIPPSDKEDALILAPFTTGPFRYVHTCDTFLAGTNHPFPSPQYLFVLSLNLSTMVSRNLRNMTRAGLEKPLEKVVLHSFLADFLWHRKVLYRIPQRKICNTDVWPGRRWYCTSSEQTSKYHDGLADRTTSFLLLAFFV